MLQNQNPVLTKIPGHLRITGRTIDWDIAHSGPLAPHLYLVIMIVDDDQPEYVVTPLIVKDLRHIQKSNRIKF